MQSVQNVLVAGLVVFLVYAALSLWLTHKPQTPRFARNAPGGTGSPQLRHDLNARILYDRGFLFRRRAWFVATCCPPRRLPMRNLGEWTAAQYGRPVLVAANGPRRWWWFEDAFYWETARYAERDVLALIRERQRKDKQRLDRAHSMLNTEAAGRNRREPISREMRRRVFERDGGRCVQCGNNFDLQYDHVIPVALGGATSVENLQLLCGPCNREKGADI